MTFVGGCKYFMLFINDYSSMTWIYFLQQKSKAFGTYKKVHVMIENKAQSKICTRRRNNGEEFSSLVFENYLCQNGIQHHLTILDTSQQNGIVERMRLPRIWFTHCISKA